MHTEEPPPINFCDLQERAKEFYSALLGLLPYVESFQNQVYKVKPLLSCADGGRQSQLELLKGQLEALVSQVARMKSTMHVIRGDLDKIQNDSTSEVDTFISATAVLKFESPGKFFFFLLCMFIVCTNYHITYLRVRKNLANEA